MTAEALERALSYPYPIPSASYVYENGDSRSLDGAAEVPDLGARTPVLAVSSNQSPIQLARKFDGPDWGAIPVIRVTLPGFDTVYSSHIAAYGSVAATLHSCPEATVTLFVTWLTAAQLARMHETEISAANYAYGRLRVPGLKAEMGPHMDTVHLYASRRGILRDGGQPIPLSEVEAAGRRWPSMTQRQIQAHICETLAPGTELKQFLLASIDDPDERKRRTEVLSQSATPVEYPAFSTIEI